jgi:hypothetical protein
METTVINDSTISGAWFQMVTIIRDHTGAELSPLLITLSGIDPATCEAFDPVRTALDTVLVKRGLNSTNTVANTIFPQSLYRFAKFEREKLYALYLDLVPRMKAIDRRNRDGIYFERLIRFDEVTSRNQLEFIISEFNGRTGVRKSMLQAAIFDPNRDHKRVAQLGFPCMQHVSFTYSNNRLTLHAFYATQQLFDKAYGNLLGLVRLASFMAREMHLVLEKVSCYVGVEKLERIPKSDPDIAYITEIAQQYLIHDRKPAIC